MTNGNDDDDDDDGDEKDADDQDRDEGEQDEGEWTKTSAHTLLLELLGVAPVGRHTLIATSCRTTQSTKRLPLTWSATRMSKVQ